jgi:alkanesulfonate monooxygenase SsuD/methylene tetrahydromethanopterin reductase-like flavin-dependent oxidoreductase (luciferase family)
MFALRFAMRAPHTPPTDLYGATLDMCAWAATRGAVMAVLSEHHGTADGHLAAPGIQAAAIAACTSRLAILLAAVPIPFWDPARLAEICALDIISRGRISVAFGIGHRAEEYEHFGVHMSTRGKEADERLALLLRLLAGETVEHEGRRITVTPGCVSASGPLLLLAGGTRAAARRAARHGLGFISQTDAAALKEFYEAECRGYGQEPGMVQFAAANTTTAVFVADDVDRAWDELGPFILHDAVTAAAYRNGDDTVASIAHVDTLAALRQAGGPYRILTIDEAAGYLRGGRPLLPLCGGLPPDLAWPYLQRAVVASERT